MKKHAYLIMAHNNWKILEKLLILLDDKRNDIYLHIDLKSDFIDFSSKVHNANLFIFHEIDVRWGDISLIQVEFFLFKTAYCKGNYSYYHLISGSDLPLKTQDEIHAFFDAHYPTEFIGFSLGMTCDNRINKVYIFPKYQRIMKQYRFASCGDEVYKQTIIGNSFLFNSVYDKVDDYKGCMRFIDWNKGNPYIFRSIDFEQLMSSDRMFARKFDEKVDFDIVERIFEALDKQKR